MREYKFRAWDKKKRKMLYLSPNDTILFQNGKCTVEALQLENEQLRSKVARMKEELEGASNERVQI